MRQYAHREDRKAYMRTYLKEWRRLNRDKMQAYDDKWRSANPEAARVSDKKKQKKHYDSHPEYRQKAVDRTKRWIQTNPIQAKRLRKAVSDRYRARKYTTRIGSIDYDRIISDSNGLCSICSKVLTIPIDLDHVIPLSRGGSHTQDNLQATHASCNRRKNRRLMSELKAA